MSEKEDHGKATEDLVEQVCNITFLEDFVVRSPKFQKGSGETKEAADFLVPFKQTLLAFQVKSRTELKPGSQKSEVDYGRIKKTIRKGIAQLKTIRRAVRNGQLVELRNTRGISIRFDPKYATRIIGVVVVDLIGEEKFSEEERTAIHNGYAYEHGMHIHIFRRQDFEVIATEVDTLPDFIEYLDTRQLFYEKRILGPLTNELDFLALYKVNPELIQQCMEGKCDLLVVDDGIWHAYRSKHAQNIRRRDILNRPSLLVEEIIAHLHTAIGYTPPVQVPGGRNDVQQGTVENYIAASMGLSSLNRLQRRTIGEKFLERMKKADKTGHGHSLIIDEKQNSAVLVLATNRSRQERTNGLFNLSAMAYCGLKLKQIIGIVSEPLSARLRSYDVIFLRDVTFENADGLVKAFEESFGKVQQFRSTEFGGLSPTRPKE